MDIILTIQELRNLTSRSGFEDDTIHIDKWLYIKMLKADLEKWRYVANTYAEATFNKRVVVFDWLDNAKSWRMNRNYEKARNCIGHARRNRLADPSRLFNLLPK